MIPFAKMLGADVLYPSTEEDKRTALIRRMIYLYALLWIFEGALRKWFLPGLSDALLIVRDPVVLVIYLLAIGRGVFPMNGFVISAALLSFVGFGTAMSMGHGNLFVALYGVRTMILHFPLIFLVPRVMTLRHVLFFAKLTLWIALPITALLVLQFLSSPTAWVNRGLKGEGTAGFSGALGRMRPPGIWSFIVGPILFYPFVASCWFTCFARQRRLTLLLLAAGVCVMIACPISISRSLVLGTILATGICLAASVRVGLMSIKTVAQLTVGMILVLAIASLTPVFKLGTTAFSSRWESSTTNKGGVETAILGRIMNDVTEPLQIGFDTPLFGYGIGAGTNAGAKLLIGRATFLAGEAEASRMVMENGLILGWGWICLRLALTVYLFLEALWALKRKNPYPMFLFGAVGICIFQGQWAQPTILGFTCLGAGLLLAACKTPLNAPSRRPPASEVALSRS